MQITGYQESVLSRLTEAGVEYAVVGAMAMKAHGMTRETSDIDLLVSRLPSRSVRLYELLTEMLGPAGVRVTPEQLQLPKKLIALPGRDAHEVDILTSIGALDTDAAINNAPTARFGTVNAKFLGLKELIYTKVVSAEANLAPEAKERDLNDLAALLKHWQSTA